MGKKILVLLGMALLVVSIFTGCASSDKSSVTIDSGVVDQNYNGDTDPTVEKQWKLTEEEKKNGVEKISIEVDGMADQVNDDQQTSDTEATQEQSTPDSGGEQNVKPNI